MLQFALFTAPGGALIADYSSRIQQLQIATNTRGGAECSGFVPMSIAETFELYDRAGLPHVVFSSECAETIYEGRLEDVNIVDVGVELRAFGYSRALSDAPYTALWSASKVGDWRVMTTADIGNRQADKFIMDSTNRLYIGLKKNAVYTTTAAADVASWLFQTPHGGSRKLVGLMIDVVETLPVNWNFDIEAWNDGWTGGINIKTIAGGTGTNPRNIFIDFSATPRDFVVLETYYNGGGTYTNVAEDGVYALIFTNIRLVTSVVHKVDTTLTAAVGPGNNLTATVGSTANMYVGQRLHIGIPASIGYSTTVKQILSSTQFVGDFTAAHGAGNNVQAHVIYADEIVKDLRSIVSTLNTTQLAATDALIQSPSLDLFDEVYEDQYPADILDRLITLGDNQTPPRQWEWGVAPGRLLFFRPQGSTARTWYVDVSSLEIQRSIDALANSVYATDQEAGGRTLRTAVSTDAASVSRYGLTRRKQIDVRSTSSTQANAQRDAALQDSKDPRPKSGLTIDRVFDAAGQPWPLWVVSPGDTVVIRNLPPTLSTAIDRIRVFRLTRTDYHADDNTLLLEPETPLPTIDALLSLAVAPSWVVTPWWIQIQNKGK